MLNQLTGPVTKANLFGKEVMLTRAANDHIAIVPSSSNDKPKIVPISQLNLAFTRGNLTFPFEVFDELPEAANLSEEERLKQDMLMQYVRRLMNQEFRSSRRVAKIVINEVSREFGDTAPPSVSTLIRALKRYTQFGNLSHARRKRPQRFHDAVYDLFIEIIDDMYLVLGGASATQCWEEFDKRAKAEFEGQFKHFSKSTFFKHIHQLDRISVIEAREGKKAARTSARSVYRSLVAERILERVEMDAVHINVGLINEDGHLVTQVIIYTLIDCYSRCILGYHLQEKVVIDRTEKKPKTRRTGESKEGVLQSIISALSPKPQMTFAKNTLHWCMYGLGESNVMDASGQYSSHDISGFICAAGGDVLIAEAGAGYRKPYIERFFGTLRTQFLKIIPGYFGKMKEAKHYDHPINEHAHLTVKQFEDLFCNYIVTCYHQRPHKGLSGKTPQQVWDECVNDSTVMLKTHDIDRLVRKNIAPIKRTIQGHQGIQINNQFYNSKPLQKLYDLLTEIGEKANPKVECIFTPLEEQQIWVKHPYTGEVILARAKDTYPDQQADETDEENAIKGADHAFGFNHPLIAAARAKRDERFETLKANKRNNPVNTAGVEESHSIFEVQAKTDSAPTFKKPSNSPKTAEDTATSSSYYNNEEYAGAEIDD